MKALFGKRVAVTRPSAQAARLSELLKSEGAIPIAMPLNHIEPLYTPEQGVLCAEALAASDWLAFTSANAVHHFVAWRGTRAQPDARVAAVGDVTATTLESYGWRVDLVPAISSVAGLTQAFGDVRGLRITHPCGEGATALSDALTQRGAHVRRIIVYRRVPTPVTVANNLVLDAALFASGSAVESWVEAGLHVLQPDVCVVCIGPVTAAVAGQHNLIVNAVAAEATDAGLVAALLGVYGAQIREGDGCDSDR